MRPDVLRPLETTWEALVLGGGASAAFGNPTLPLEVEIGPGDDDFLLHAAAARPGVNWLGIEYSRKRVRRYVRRVLDRHGPLPNLRLIWRPAGDVVGPFLTPARVAAFHVHFPDPWPKKHHHRYRLLTAPFLGDLARALVPGGALVVLTDDRAYAEEVASLGAGEPLLANPVPPPGFRVVAPRERETVFETQWREAGLDIHLLRFTRTQAQAQEVS